MNNIQKALLWAAAILFAAIMAKTSGLSDGASFGIIAGLSGAAWGAFNGGCSSSRKCLL